MPTLDDQAEYAFEIENVSRVYRLRSGLGQVRTLQANHRISLAVRRGEVVGLVGESGSGKTTLAKMMLGLEHPTEGRIQLFGQDLEKLRLRDVASKVQFIFQDPYSSLNPLRPIDEAVAYPLYVQGIGTRTSRREAAWKMLAQTGIPERSFGVLPSQLSGGQRQRVVIARALILQPSVLICDEPTSALDVSVQAQILNLMRDLQDEFGLTYLLISHDLSVVRHMSSRIGVLYLGRLVEVADGKKLFTDPGHPYSRMLLDAVPDLTLSGRRRRRVEGEIPNPINPPPGCAFHPRCPHAFDRCKLEIPQPKPRGNARVACFAVEEGRI